MLHFSRTRESLLSTITQNYCSQSGACGSFIADRPYKMFDLNNFEDKIESSFYLFPHIKEYVNQIGIYGGCIFLCQQMLRIMSKIRIMYSLYFHQNTDIRSTLKLTFRLEDNIRNEIIDRKTTSS